MTQGARPTVQAGARNHRPTTAGDESFDDFFRSSWAWAFRLAYLLTRDRAAGEDVAQQAMVDVLRRWESIDNPGGYLRRSIVNRANNLARASKVRREKLPVLAADDSWLAMPEANEMIDALAALPYRQRAVIVMRYYLDLSEAEIAETLGCRPGTVKSLCWRGLRQLRREQTT